MTSDLIVDLTNNGQSMSTAIGNESFQGNVTVVPSGIALGITQASVVAVPSIIATPSGIALTSAIGTATAAPETIATPSGVTMSVNISTPGVIAWSPVTPNITNTWTGVDDSNTNIWTEVDDREVA